MKKIKLVLVLFFIFFVFSCSTAMAANWTIEVNGEKLDADVQIIDGRSLIPLRAVGEALGLQVMYFDEQKTVYLRSLKEGKAANDDDNTDGIVCIYLNTGTMDYAVNKDIYTSFGTDLKLAVAPANIDNRLYVPVRLICNVFGAPVDVDGTTIKIQDIYTAGELQSIDSLIAKPETNSTEIVKIGESADGVTVLKYKENADCSDHVYLSLEGNTVIVPAEDYKILYSKYGLKCFKFYYDQFVSNMRMQLKNPVTALFGCEIPNLTTSDDYQAAISYYPEKNEILVSGWVYAQNGFGGYSAELHMMSLNLDGSFKGLVY